MSAGNTASSQVRRSTVAAPAHPTQSPARSTVQFGFTVPHGEDEIRLNLSDIPRVRLDEDMHVEGFKPSLLSRFLDLVAPLKR